MSDLRALVDKVSYQQLPHIQRSEIQLLWVGDIWDIPLDGMLAYQNRKCLYRLFNKEEFEASQDGSVEPIYIILELSAEQLQEEEYWHDLFIQKVWNGWDLDQDQRVIWSSHPEKVQRGTEDTSREYYEAYSQRVEPDYSHNAVIGWFMLR